MTTNVFMSDVSVEYFPTMAYCDYKLHSMGGNIHTKRTVQCFMNMNIATEKLFLYLYFVVIVHFVSR